MLQSTFRTLTAWNYWSILTREFVLTMQRLKRSNVHKTLAKAAEMGDCFFLSKKKKNFFFFLKVCCFYLQRNLNLPIILFCLPNSKPLNYIRLVAEYSNGIIDFMQSSYVHYRTFWFLIAHPVISHDFLFINGIVIKIINYIVIKIIIL